MAANSTICSHSKLIIPLFNWTNRSIRWGAISVAHTRQSKSFPTPVNNIRGKLWALSQQISSFPSGQLGMSNITNFEQISNYLLIHKMRVYNQQSHTWKCTEYIWLFSSWLLIDNMHRTSDNVSYWHRRWVQWTAQNQSGCLAMFGNWFLRKLQIYLSHKRIKKKRIGVVGTLFESPFLFTYILATGSSGSCHTTAYLKHFQKRWLLLNPHAVTSSWRRLPSASCSGIYLQAI